MKICKGSYTKKSVNNQKAQKFVPVLDENLSVKNAPKRSAKYLEDKIFKIKTTQNISVTLRTFLILICIKSVPGDTSTIFFRTIFTQKMPESSGSMYSSILILGNIYYHFTWCGPNSQEFVPIYSCQLSPLQAKWCHVF